MSETDSIQQLQAVIEELFGFYGRQSCPCAFPRFRELVAIDCVEYGMAFMCYESELMIAQARQFFGEAWTCPTCRSEYEHAWEDFSIHVSRSILKVKALRAESIGAPVQRPLPLFRGFIGHQLPSDPGLFVRATLEDFRTYMLKI